MAFTRVGARMLLRCNAIVLRVKSLEIIECLNIYAHDVPAAFLCSCSMCMHVCVYSSKAGVAFIVQGCRVEKPGPSGCAAS